jgi:hypothetical protein
VLLEGIVADAGRMAVHMTASGGELAVFMQHSRLQGLSPGGVDFAVPGDAPALEVLVPAVSVTGTDFDSPLSSALRVVNPGERTATVAVALWGPEGPVTLPGLTEAVVGPGLVADLALAGLPGGFYAARVTSSEPVAVAALSLRTGEPEAPQEFAWTAGGASPDHGYLALPKGGVAGRVVLASDTDTTVELRGVASEGARAEPVTKELKAGTTVAFTPEELGAEDGFTAIEYTFPSGGRVTAAMALEATDDKGQSVGMVTPTGHSGLAGRVTVYQAH